MKKVIVVISILLLLFCHFSAVCEEIDLESMGDLELTNLLSRVLEEIGSRDNFTSDMYWPGTYICGEDFEPGVYLVETVGSADTDHEKAFMYGWESKESKKEDRMDYLFYEVVSMGSTRKFEFVEGNVFEIQYCICSMTAF